MYLVPTENAEEPFSWDAEDEQIGYECFGGPTGDRGATFPIQQLGGWLPGQSGNTYPDGIGIRVEPGSTIVLQMHYNVATADPTPDQSKFQFSLIKEPTAEGWYAPFLDIGWVLGSMEIPAGEASVVHALVDDPRSFFNLVVGDHIDLSNGFRIHAATFHMHQLGVRGELSHVPRGPSSVLLNIEEWDFNWQRQYTLTTPFDVPAGDKLKVECEFDNSTGNQPVISGKAQMPVDVSWGEGTGDEMCVANLLITALPNGQR